MNVLTITGRLTAEPVRRDTAKGVLCEFRLAVDGRPRLWIGVEAWGHLAGRCAHHLHAGRHVAVTGPLVCEQYATRAGERATRWFTRATALTFLERPNRHDDELGVGTAEGGGR
jgi:single-stranded DNA-binding protein